MPVPSRQSDETRSCPSTPVRTRRPPPPQLSLRMAAVAVPPSPQVIDAMATRRVPLANLQNATNSPLRATAVGGKRQRSHASEQRDVLYGQPPTKKPMIEVDDAESRRTGLVRRSGAPTTALTRRLEAARDEKIQKPAPKAVDRTQRATNENLDQIRQWQKHYRTQFPRFVFYFESIPEDIKYKVWKQAYALGSVCIPPCLHVHH